MTDNNLIIRNETENDYRDCENLMREAFWNVYRPGCSEHYVLHCFRTDPAFVKELDFVAELDGKIIGQVIYVRATIDCADGKKVPIVTLGPIGILPEYKRKGFGKKLLDFSLAKAAELGFGAVVIEGNIDFYGKSGFTIAKEKGIRYFDDPEADYLLVKEFKNGYLDGVNGTFADPEGYFVPFKNPQGFDAFEAGFPKKEKLVLDGQLFKE